MPTLGELIQSVLEPTDNGDERLREMAASGASSAVAALDSIREIVIAGAAASRPIQAPQGNVIAKRKVAR